MVAIIASKRFERLLALVLYEIYNHAQTTPNHARMIGVLAPTWVGDKKSRPLW